jgi:hypothetical protein
VPPEHIATSAHACLRRGCAPLKRHTCSGERVCVSPSRRAGCSIHAARWRAHRPIQPIAIVLQSIANPRSISNNALLLRPNCLWTSDRSSCRHHGPIGSFISCPSANRFRPACLHYWHRRGRGHSCSALGERRVRDRTVYLNRIAPNIGFQSIDGAYWSLYVEVQCCALACLSTSRRISGSAWCWASSSQLPVGCSWCGFRWSCPYHFFARSPSR